MAIEADINIARSVQNLNSNVFNSQPKVVIQTGGQKCQHFHKTRFQVRKTPNLLFLSWVFGFKVAYCHAILIKTATGTN